MSRWISVAVTPDGVSVFPHPRGAGPVDKSQALIGAETIALSRSGQIDRAPSGPVGAAFSHLIHRVFPTLGIVIHQVQGHLSTGCRQVVENLFDTRGPQAKGPGHRSSPSDQQKPFGACSATTATAVLEAPSRLSQRQRGAPPARCRTGSR